MAEKQAPKIVFYTTSCPSTLKVRGDIERITQILHAKRTVYEEVSRQLQSASTSLNATPE